MAMLVSIVVGFTAGALQSLLIGLRAARWEIGTGILWGIIVAVPAGVLALFLGWYAVPASVSIATVGMVVSWLSMRFDGRGMDGG